MRTAERIYSASTSEDGAVAGLAEKLARLIEDDIASNMVPVGGVMGSLRELSERYSVGRAAAREAVALLERRGLGRLRPGPCGGFVVAQPDFSTIGAELANYFRMAGVTLTQLKDAREAVDSMVAGLAASARPDTGQLAGLVRPDEGGAELDWHLHIRAGIAELTGQPVIELFVECLNDLTSEFALAPGQAHGWEVRAASQGETLRKALADGDVNCALSEAAKLHERLQHCLQREDGPLQLPAIDTSRLADDRTLATLVARKLGAEILSSAGAGQRLGSEWDLCERLSVSRATLRQAIRQLQDSGLVECRRGRGNGLVVRDLRGTGSIRLMLAYLISRQMDPMAAGTILFQLNRFVPALAVNRADKAQRARLKKLLEKAQRSDPIDRYDLLRLVQWVSHLSDSPIIDLFSRCLAAYEARFRPFLAEWLPAHLQAEYFDLLHNLLDKLDSGDTDRLEWAKRESAHVMLEMSRSRPL
jgi:DNA-binding FadR family transcriptional regulator